MAAQAVEFLELVETTTRPQETTINLRQEIEALAYRLWMERGCPIGSDQEDWFRAESILNVKNETPQETTSK
jgi:hypothetical protein